MRIIDRYLIKGFLGPLLFCIVLFCVLFVIIDVFNHLDEFIKYGVFPKIILSYYLYFLPSLLIQVIPISTLVAILYVLGHLNKHNEITALKASGVSTFHILSPYLFMGMLISFAVFLTNETIAPQSAITSRAIMDGLILKGKKNLGERAIKNVTLYGQNNRMIFAREYEITHQTLHDVVVLENDSSQILKAKLIAKKAKFDPDKNIWIFHDAMRYELNRRGEMLGEPVYSDKLKLELPERPEDFVKEASEVEFMSAKQLRDYIQHMEGSSKKLIRRLWVDFHYKVAFPFLSFIVILIGAPLALRSERGSAMLGIGTSLVIVFAYYAIDSICLAMGKGGYLPVIVAAWVANLSFAIVGIYLIRKTA
jgi:lipopolysaccharide export system permease protein